ncbi:MAG TPA: alkaline phosphatase PhoX, partial [Polyangiales bacterium]|nr:alkaline phosphatase PhoX [Polyangiales bacterium]
RVTPNGEIVDFARNATSLSEFTGPCFSPDGGTMFVNIQHDGLTLAIRGPFDREQFGPTAQAHAAPEPWSIRPSVIGGIGTGLAVVALAALARRKRKPR